MRNAVKSLRLVGLAGVLAVCLGAGAASCDDAAARAELAPTGTLRAAIAVGPAPSGIYALKDASGGYRGVTIELARRIASRLGVPLAFVPYRGSGEIQAAAASGAWDVSFMPVDAERRKYVDFGAPYHLLESTYLVSARSDIARLADAGRPRTKIAGVRDTATLRASMRVSPQAEHVVLASVDECVSALRDGRVDAVALGRASLGGLLDKVPGSAILKDNILQSTTAVAVPKGKAAALAYASDVVEEAKRDGSVRRAFDAVGLTAEVVAPAGMLP